MLNLLRASGIQEIHNNPQGRQMAPQLARQLSRQMGKYMPTK